MKSLKDIFNEVMNLGITLRQNQLSGWSGESGNEVLENYLKENEQRISKILENDFEEELKVGDKVCFTSDCQDEFDLTFNAVGTVLKPFIHKNLYFIRVINGEEEFDGTFFTNQLIKL